MKLLKSGSLLGLVTGILQTYASAYTSLTNPSVSCPTSTWGGPRDLRAHQNDNQLHTSSGEYHLNTRYVEDRRHLLRRRGSHGGLGQVRRADYRGGDGSPGIQGDDGSGWTPSGPPQVQIVSKCSVPSTVALTFDDGPSQYLRDVVTTLKSANVTGTFFFNGKNYGCIYDQQSVDNIKFAYEQGHLIASHGWSHKDLALLGWDELNREMGQVDNALTKILGVLPAFIRPAYGSTNDLVIRAANSRGQTVVLWDFDCQDTAGASGDASKALYDAAIERHPDSILTLNHETKDIIAFDVLPYAIQKLQAAGYRLVSVAECLGMQPYQRVGAPSARDDSWQC